MSTTGLTADLDRRRLGAIYSRISNDEVGDELGVKRHTRLCLQLADRLGITVPPEWVFIDDDRSGFSGVRRKQWDAARALLATGQVGNLLTYDSDRLSRENLRKVEDLIDLLQGNDVLLHSTTSGMFDLNTVDGRERARGAAVRARADSERSSKRLRDKMTELIEAGKSTGGAAPYGWRRTGAKPLYRGQEDTRKLVPVPEEAKVVVEMTERIARGETLTRIAQDLNARGIPTRQGNTWTATNLRRVVANGANAGLLFHNGQEVGRAEWADTAFVDEALWRRAHRILTHPERATLNRRSARKYLLSGGLLRCGECGKQLFSKPLSGGAAGYVCSPKKDLHHPGCGALTVMAEPVEAIVAEAVIRRVESPAFAAAIGAREGHDADAAAEAAAIEAEMADLARDLSNGALTLAEWKAARPGYERRLAAARSRIAADTAVSAIGPYLGRPDELRREWERRADDLDWRQAIIRSVLDHVVIAKATPSGPRFNPDRVGKAVWKA